MVRAMALFAASISALIVLLLAGAMATASTVSPPTAEGLDDIPAPYLALYRDATATRCATLPWAVLAAIGKIESNHGRTGGARLHAEGRVDPPIIGIALDGSAGTQRILDTDGGVHDGDTVHDRAVGPMQFIPTTWARIGVDASGDGLADPHNAIDAVHASAAYLCAAGVSGPTDVRDAVWAYNHSWDYVDKVLAVAARYAAGTVGRVAASLTLIAVVLANPRLDIYEAGRTDIAAGRIDARVLTVLQLASQNHTLRISSLESGHSRCVGGGDYPGCRVSHHWHGRAVDISRVDGRSVTAANASARVLAVWLASLPESLQPEDVGTPWSDLRHRPGYFSDVAHQNHLHVGFGQSNA